MWSLISVNYVKRNLGSGNLLSPRDCVVFTVAPYDILILYSLALFSQIQKIYDFEIFRRI